MVHRSSLVPGEIFDRTQGRRESFARYFTQYWSVPPPTLKQSSDKMGTTNPIPEEDAFLIGRRRQHRLMSLENTTLTEVITVYEKLKKGHEKQVLNNSRIARNNSNIILGFNEAEETVPMVPKFNSSSETLDSKKTMLDFTKFKTISLRKYLYFSPHTNLLLSDTIEKLSPNYSELLQMRNYWLNIYCPSEQDFSTLCHSYGVHELTISDIREKNSEEKLEVFKHYTFLSMKLLREDNNDTENITYEDVDFNILLFKDFVITIHDKCWPSITNILGFLSILFQHAGETLNPDWILFSVFMELNQDAKYSMDFIEREVNRIRIDSKTMEVSDMMRRNFEMELQIYSISRFIKPKIRILHLLKKKCSKRIDGIVIRLLGDILEDYREINQDISHFNHMLERSQDTFLAIISSDQTREANEMSKVMKRISEIALVFLPIQAIASFLGMNVTVPFQTDNYPSELYFWLIVGVCVLVGSTLFFLRKGILSY